MALDVFFLSKTPAYSVWHYQNNKNMEKKDIRTFDLSSHDCFVNKGEIICTKNRFPLIFILNMAIRY